MSNLMDMLCKVRDVLVTKDTNKIKDNLFFITRLTDEARRQIKKNGINNIKQLEFNSYDLKELSEEMMEVIKICEKKINVAHMLKGLYKKDAINDNVINEFTKISAEYMRIRACLTSAHSLIVFLGVLLNLFEEQTEQGKIDNVLASAIKELL